MEIWHDIQNGSGSTLISMSCQKLAVSMASSVLVDLCPNIWCNHPKETFFLGIFLCDFDIPFVFTKNACFICVMCGNVAAFCLLSLKKTVQKLLWKGRYVPNSLIQQWKIINHTSLVPIPRYITYQWRVFYCCREFIFEIILFVSLLQNAHLQLWYIYMFPPMRPV